MKLFLFAGTALSTTWVLTRGVDAQFYGLTIEWSAAEYINSVVRGLLAASFAVAVTVWVFGRGRRRILDETVFALHALAALAIWSTLAIWVATCWKLGWGTAARVPAGVPSLLYLVFLPAGAAGLAYFGIALRRVHGGSWWSAALRTLLLSALAITVIMLAILAPRR